MCGGYKALRLQGPRDSMNDLEYTFHGVTVIVQVQRAYADDCPFVNNY